MGIFDRWIRPKEAMQGQVAYQAVVAIGRDPHWYLDGAVADSVDGRFDMIAAVLSMVLLRLEAGTGGDALAAALAERFVDDMDSQLRQGGVGDVMVGKQIGKLMSMLGGRLGAYRDGMSEGPAAFDAALKRNLYREQPVNATALEHVREALTVFRERLDGQSVEAIEAGQFA